MDGVIQGGWEYVWAAWGISLSMLACYALIVVLRLQAARKGAGK